MPDINSINYFFWIIAFYSLYLYFRFRNVAKKMLLRIGINDKYSSKYVQPSRFIKRHFKLKETYIPKFICLEFYFSLFFIFMMIIELILCFLVDFFPDLLFILVFFIIIQPIVAFINLIWFLILASIYQNSFQNIKKKIEMLRHKKKDDSRKRKK